MSALRIGSLCSGYGGLDLAVEAMFNAETVWHAEIEPAACRILEAHWPGVPNLGDIKAAAWDLDADILTAGYPCQPFSQAGKRKGTDDERHLWPHVAEAVRRIRPRYVVLENVAGHRSLGFGRVLADMAALGYVGSWVSVRASDVGAPHQRERIFILAADTRVSGRQRRGADGVGRSSDAATRRSDPAVADTGHGADAERSWQAGRVGGERASVGVESRRGSDAAADASDVGHERSRASRDGGTGPANGDRWGVYGPAIRRWERTLGRVAPSPTERGSRGGRRLSPWFVEWMQGLDEGHVCGVDGLSRNEQLKALGNGVVPQQAAEALRRLRANVESVAA